MRAGKAVLDSDLAVAAGRGKGVFLPRKIVSRELGNCKGSVEERRQPAGHADLRGLLRAKKLLTRVSNCQMSVTAFLAFLCSLANDTVFISFQKRVSNTPCFSRAFDYI